MNLVLQELPVSEPCLKEIKEKQLQDETSQTLMKYCTSEWPDCNRIASSAKPYIPVANELSVYILLRGNRIVIPSSIRQEILEKLHCGHQGITKCRERACQSVWWLGIDEDIKIMIKKCWICSQHRTQYPEPLILTSFPEYPWQELSLIFLSGKSPLTCFW